MKTTLNAVGLLMFFLITIGCRQDLHSELSSLQPTEQSATRRDVGCPSYSIVLESRNPDNNGNWVWVWSVQNPNPGNGTNCTIQDLSHWGMQFGTCVTQSSILNAAYSTNGTSWNSVSPNIQVDPSQECMTDPVLKFDHGTTGSAKTWYRITVNHDYNVVSVPAYYKSGNRTGCGVIYISGMGCEPPPAR